MPRVVPHLRMFLELWISKQSPLLSMSPTHTKPRSAATMHLPVTLCAFTLFLLLPVSIRAPVRTPGRLNLCQVAGLGVEFQSAPRCGHRGDQTAPTSQEASSRFQSAPRCGHRGDQLFFAHQLDFAEADRMLLRWCAWDGLVFAHGRILTFRLRFPNRSASACVAKYRSNLPSYFRASLSCTTRTPTPSIHTLVPNGIERGPATVMPATGILPEAVGPPAHCPQQTLHGQ